MKKFFLILICIFTVIGIFSAANADIPVHIKRRVKCVPLVDGSETTCTSNFNSYVNFADWGAECATNGVTSEVKGIAACSNQLPDSCRSSTTGCDWTYTTDPTMRSQTITTSSDASQNTNCWCKMTTPAVSLWVFNGDYGDASSCAMICAHDCAALVQVAATGGAALRSALFSGMTD